MTRLSTTVLGLGSVAALAASFAVGVAVASDDGTAPPTPPRTTAAGPHRAVPMSYAGGALAAPASCDDLLDWYVEQGVEQVGPWGWRSPHVWSFDRDGIVFESFAGAAASDAGRGAAIAPTTTRVTNSATGTNVQEAGVDEPDVVKTDGSLLVRIQEDELTTYDVSGDRVDRVGSLDLDVADGEMLLVGDRVVVLSPETNEDDLPSTVVVVVDVSDPAAPEVTDTATYDTEYVSARQHGDVVRLVVSARLPDLDFVEPRRWRGEREARDHNQDVVRESTIEDWLPTVTRDGEKDQVLDCGQIALPDDESGLGTVAVVGFDPGEPETWSAQGVATASQLAYFSPDRMYLATSPWSGAWGCCWVEDGAFTQPRLPAVQDGASRVYAFELDDLAATYVASAEIDGSIADRWSMDAAGGVLRVAVGPTQRTGNFNSVVLLEEDGDELVEIGRVDRLGVNETIRSVRWFDDLAIVVTFRQVDPLYAVDLTDPSGPELIGKLKVPGFSSYLHPLGSMRMIGMGEGPSSKGWGWGAQAGLFDVTDLTDPRRLDVVSYRNGTQAGAGTDPRQFTWLPAERTVLTVVSRGYGPSTGWVSVLRLGHGQLDNRMVRVEYGTEISQVRLVPLPDGRVVLVTGDGVRFFDL